MFICVCISIPHLYLKEAFVQNKCMLNIRVCMYVCQCKCIHINAAYVKGDLVRKKKLTNTKL